MQKKYRILLLVVSILTAAIIFSACSPGEIPDETVTEQTSDSPPVENSITVAQSKIIRLGSSFYAVTADRRFYSARVSNDDWLDDMTAHYINERTLLEFSVYQFSKDGFPDKLKEFAKQEAEDYDAYEVKTDLSLNGIDAAYYRAIDDEEKDGITFILDAGEEYLEVDFFFEDSNSESEAWEIMNSLEKIGNKEMELGTYKILLPIDFTLVSEEENLTVYKDGSDSLSLYIKHYDASEIEISDLTYEVAVSDVQSDIEINGVPVTMYRSVEPLDGAYRSMLNCVLSSDSDAFTVLSFRLDGITAEIEAQAILNTLSQS